MKSIGEQYTKVFEEIADDLWTFEAGHPGVRFEFGKNALRATLKMFMSVMGEEIWALQEKENIAQKDRIAMIQSFGKAVRELVKNYADVDTFEMWND